MSLFQRSIVRIHASDGKPVGTGFLISDEGHILTCAHVIVPSKLQRTGNFTLPNTVTCSWIFPDIKPFTAKLLTQLWVDSADGDMAVLKVEGALPQSAYSVVFDNPGDHINQQFTAFGFPKEKPEGLNAYGLIRDQVRRNRVIIETQLDDTDGITLGFSGGPIFVETEHLEEGDELKVVGMLRAIQKRDFLFRLQDISYGIKPQHLEEKLGGLIKWTQKKLASEDEEAEDGFDPFEHEQREITCLIDRNEQDIKLLEKLQSKHTLREPTHGIGILHGMRLQGHEIYRNRLRHFKLDEMFNKGEHLSKPKFMGFLWPRQYKDIDELTKKVVYDISSKHAKELIGNFTIEALSKHLYGVHNGVIVFHTNVSLDKLTPEFQEDFCGFWEQWPARSNQGVMMVILQVIYGGEAEGELSEEEEAAVKMAIENFDFGALQNFSGFVFPRLTGIDRDHFLQWFEEQSERKALKMRTDLSKFRETILAYFDNNKGQGEEALMPLEKVVNKIKETLR